MPTDREQYIHRLGRTGRKGNEGAGVLLLAPWEEYLLRSIKDLPITEATQPLIDLDTKKKVLKRLQFTSYCCISPCINIGCFVNITTGIYVYDLKCAFLIYLDNQLAVPFLYLCIMREPWTRYFHYDDSLKIITIGPNRAVQL